MASLYDLAAKKKKRTTISYTDPNNTNRVLITLDAVIREGHSSEIDITEHPIEDGSTINDHTVIKPKTFTMDGLVSNHPISLAAAAASLATGAVGSVGVKLIGSRATPLLASGISALGGNLTGGDKNRAKNAHDALLMVQSKSIPLTISTGLQCYNNMLLKSISVDRNASNSEALQFTATFQEVNVVTSETVKIPAKAKSSSIAKSATNKLNAGKQSVSSIAGKLQEKSSSVLSKLGGLF